MKKVGVFNGKAQFSALVEAAEHGEGTIVTKRGKPVARIVPVTSSKPSQAFGMDHGLVTISLDFDSTPLDFKEYV